MRRVGGNPKPLQRRKGKDKTNRDAHTSSLRKDKDKLWFQLREKSIPKSAFILEKKRKTMLTRTKSRSSEGKEKTTSKRERKKSFKKRKGGAKTFGRAQTVNNEPADKGR